MNFYGWLLVIYVFMKCQRYEASYALLGEVGAILIFIIAIERLKYDVLFLRLKIILIV